MAQDLCLFVLLMLPFAGLVLREKLDSRILQNTLTPKRASYSLHYSDNKNAQVKTILIFRLTLLSSIGGGPHPP